MATLIAVANLKGGCGKSTIAVNLACEFASRHYSVVLVDCDAQGTANYYCEQGKLPVLSEAMPLDSARDAGRWISKVLGIEANFIILDAPPHVGAATEAVVGVSDLVLVPVTASVADLIATTEALKLVAQARTKRSDNGPKCLMVPSKIDRRTASGREIEEALKQFNEPIGPAIHQRAALVDAFGAGLWIGDYAPNSPAHEDISQLANTVKRMLRK